MEAAKKTRKINCTFLLFFLEKVTLLSYNRPAVTCATSIETAWQIYTLRGQIELTFKVWESICKIDKVKKVKKDRLECYIWAILEDGNLVAI